MTRLRRKLNFANVLACLALFVALGGTSYAALVVTGKNVKDNSLTGRDIKNGSVTAADLQQAASARAGSAGPQGPRGADGAPGPAGVQGDRGDRGPQGDRGPRGERGETGATGTVDTSDFYDKAESDDRFARGPVSGTGAIMTNHMASDPNTGWHLLDPAPYDVFLKCPADPSTEPHGIQIRNVGNLATELVVHDGVGAPVVDRGFNKTVYASGPGPRVWHATAKNDMGEATLTIGVHFADGKCRATASAMTRTY